MARRYTYEATVCLGPDEGGDFKVTVEYSLTWLSPPNGEPGPPENYDTNPKVDKVISIEGLAEGWGKAFALGHQTDQQISDMIISALDRDALVASAREQEANKESNR